MRKLALRAATMVAAGILITIGGCGESPSAPAASTFEKLRAPSAPSASKAGKDQRTIGPDGGVLQTAEGHRLVFPAGALAEPTEIRMTAMAGYVGVNLEPHGLVFPAGREPVLSLNAAGAEAGWSSLQVLYVDDAGAVLEVLPARVQGQRLVTELRHFSGYMGAGSRDDGSSVSTFDSGYMGAGSRDGTSSEPSESESATP